MVDQNEQNNARTAGRKGRKLTSRLKQGAVGAAALLASNTVRTLLLGVGLLVSAYLLWTHAWGPLKTQQPYPPGVSNRDPAIETSRIETINELRLERITPRARRFANTAIFSAPVAE